MDELKPNGSALQLGTALQAVIREVNNGLETRVAGIETRVVGIEEALRQHGYSLERIEKALAPRGHLQE